MGLRVATNIASINAQKTLGGVQRNLERSFAQLSSGSRITKAADDAAGLSISEKLKSTMRGYNQAKRNSLDAISVVQVSEGGLGEISNILTRMRELAVQAASDTIGERERGFINIEVQQIKDEMQRISETTRFGDVKLLDGSGEEFEFQVDIGSNEFQDRIKFDASAQNAQTSELGVDGFDFSTKDGARESLDVLEDAQTRVNGQRASLGAIQNRLYATIENLSMSVENYAAANSRIRDTDIAESSAALAGNQVLQSATIGVLSQANMHTANALKLIG
jgi:flagellin